MKHGAAEGGCVSGDHVERHGRHRHHHGSDEHNPPVCNERGQNFRRARPVLAGNKLISLLKRTSEPKQERNYRAAEKQRNAPSPQHHFLRRKDGTQHHPKQCGEHHSHLLACRLPTDIKALMSWCCDLCQINRDAAQFHTCREALKQAACQHKQWSQQSDGRVPGCARYGDDADGHQSQRQNKAGATPMAIGICRSEEHTSELQSPCNLVCRLLLEKKKKKKKSTICRNVNTTMCS